MSTFANLMMQTAGGTVTRGHIDNLYADNYPVSATNLDADYAYVGMNGGTLSLQGDVGQLFISGGSANISGYVTSGIYCGSSYTGSALSATITGDVSGGLNYNDVSGAYIVISGNLSGGATGYGSGGNALVLYGSADVISCNGNGNYLDLYGSCGSYTGGGLMINSGATVSSAYVGMGYNDSAYVDGVCSTLDMYGSSVCVNAAGSVGYLHLYAGVVSMYGGIGTLDIDSSYSNPNYGSTFYPADINAGGHVSSLMLNASSACVTVNSGGVVSGGIIQPGASLYVASGGSANISSASDTTNITVQDGGIVTYY